MEFEAIVTQQVAEAKLVHDQGLVEPDLLGDEPKPIPGITDAEVEAAAAAITSSVVGKPTTGVVPVRMLTAAS